MFKKSIALGIISLVIFPTVLLACGGAFIFSFDDLKSLYPNQKSHSVFINYQDGTEYLTAGLAMDAQNVKNLAWIIPVPASPESVTVDILNKEPVITSEKLEVVLSQKIRTISSLWFTSQLWSSIIPNLFSVGQGGAGVVPMLGYDVKLYSSITKNGITSEVLSAKSPDALVVYLKKKGVSVGGESLSVFDRYTNTDIEYSFVVSWVIPDTATDIGKALFISFPTKRIFYPLIPMSLSVGRQVFLDINVIGEHVTPVLPKNLEREMQTSYEVKGSISDYAEKTMNNKKDLKITKIFLNSPAEKLTEDLWIDEGAPRPIQIASILNSYVVLLAIVAYALLSLALTYILGLLLLKRIGFTNTKLFIVGLLNFLSIIGVIIGVIILNRGAVPPDVKHPIFRKIVFILLFTIIFSIFSAFIYYTSIYNYVPKLFSGLTSWYF
jgi:hypothetical protein